MCRACEELKDLGVPLGSQLRLHLMLKAEEDHQLPPIHSQDDWNQALSKVPRDYLMKAYQEALLEMPLPENWGWDDLEKLLKEVAPEDGFSWWVQCAQIPEPKVWPGLMKTVEPDAESVFLNQVLQRIALLTEKLEKLTQVAKDWVPPHRSPVQAVKADERTVIATEVKKAVDKMLHPGPGQPREGEPGSTVDLVKRALDADGWDGVEALARTRRYIG